MREATSASRNLSQAADNFEVSRRVVFYNGINGEYMLTIEGFCSKGKRNRDSRSMLTITCKTAPGVYTGVAIANGRNAVLCELNSEYVGLAPGRIASIKRAAA